MLQGQGGAAIRAGDTVTPAAVPEPSSLVLLAAGLAVLRRRRKSH